MKLHKLQQIYELAANKMLQDHVYWENFLKYAGMMYGYDFTTLASMYAQCPEHTQMASYEAWNKRNLKIRPGEKSIPAIMKNHYGMSHMFDITQLVNKPKIKNWFVDNQEREEFEQNFIRKNQKHTMSGTFSDVIGDMIVEQVNHLGKKNNSTQDFLIDNLDSIFQSVSYMVTQRCNAEKIEKIGAISNLNLDQLTCYGHFVMTISRPILINCKDVVYEMRKEQQNERARENRNGLYREERYPVRQREGGAGREVHREAGQVRDVGTGILEGKQGSTVRTSGSKGNHDADNASDRGQSEPENGRAAGGNAQEGSDQEPGKHNGDISPSSKNSRPSGRNRTKRDSVQLELDFENMEIATEKEGVIDTSSFFVQKSYGQKEIPDELLKKVLQRGTGTAGGKERVYKIFRNSSSLENKIEFLKKEFYHYGVSLYEPDEHGFKRMTCDPGKGMEITWKAQDGMKVEKLSWIQVSNVIDKLLLEDEYFTEQDRKNEKKEKFLYNESIIDDTEKKVEDSTSKEVVAEKIAKQVMQSMEYKAEEEYEMER